MDSIVASNMSRSWKLATVAGRALGGEDVDRELTARLPRGASPVTCRPTLLQAQRCCHYQATSNQHIGAAVSTMLGVEVSSRSKREARIITKDDVVENMWRWQLN